jgi:sialic acid synthase SpsE
MIREIREVEAMMGSGAKVPQPEEAESMTAIRRSIAAARALPAGTVIGPGDIAWLRPGDGFPPGEERHVLGRRLAADLAPGAIIRPEHLA